jgi:hypothetical protein
VHQVGFQYKDYQDAQSAKHKIQGLSRCSQQNIKYKDLRTNNECGTVRRVGLLYRPSVGSVWYSTAGRFALPAICG